MVLVSEWRPSGTGPRPTPAEVNCYGGGRPEGVIGMSELPPEIDTSRPHTARIYDYYLGGKNHFAADRRWRTTSCATAPSVRIAAREQRDFLGRAVRYLAAEAGIQQFLDVGTGLPTTDNVHEVAQAVAPVAASCTSTTTRWYSRTRGHC